MDFPAKSALPTKGVSGKTTDPQLPQTVVLGLPAKVTGTANADHLLLGLPPVPYGGWSVSGLEGDDTLSVQGGTNSLWGNEGDDLLLGGGGPDKLYGGLGNDILSGGGDDDFLRGDEDVNRLIGGTGADQFVITAYTDRDDIAGIDKMDILQDFSFAEGDQLVFNSAELLSTDVVSDADLLNFKYPGLDALLGTDDAITDATELTRFADWLLVQPDVADDPLMDGDQSRWFDAEYVEDELWLVFDNNLYRLDGQVLDAVDGELDGVIQVSETTSLSSTSQSAYLDRLLSAGAISQAIVADWTQQGFLASAPAPTAAVEI